jgi:predicted ATP-binding protein involved in virulence
MPKTPIYLKSLELKNIRTFGEVTLNLEKEDGSLPQWTLILGDNGIGKSTLLQCAAWMKPNVPDPDDERGDDIKMEKIEANINNEENDTLVRLVRKTDNAKEDGSIRAKFVSERILNNDSFSAESFCEQSIDIEISNGELEVFDTSFNTNKKEVFFKNEVIIYAYSASRKIGKQNIDKIELQDTIPSFISDNTILYDAEEILHTINYAAAASPENEQEKYKTYLTKIKELLVAVMPDFENVDDIIISPPQLINNRIQEIEIMINSKHGKKVPFNDYSLGYKTVASWVVDLSWRLINQYPQSPNPLLEPAIVIIDEIDLHLHPLWQREIIGNLSSHFKNVQFIATAHSPLMVQAALEANYAVLKNSNQGVKIINEPLIIKDWRIGQIVTSELFGIGSERSPEIEGAVNRRRELLDKQSFSKLSEEETKELNELDGNLAKLSVQFRGSEDNLRLLEKFNSLSKLL